MLADLCTYNIRGLNNKQEYMKDFIANNKLSLVAVMETHVQQDHSAVISRKLARNFSWVFNYNHHVNGRIWVGFDCLVWSFTVVTMSAQHITGLVKKIGSGESFVVSFVYGLNTMQERRLLWGELAAVRSTIPVGTAWVILGDFNVCLGPDETNKGSVWTSSMLEFKDFLTCEGLVDLNCSGPEFTWWDSNKRDPCFRKLDRCVVNGDWMNKFSVSKALFLPRGLSDHSPILVSLGIEHKRVSKPIQFFVHLIHAPGFLEAVADAWNVDVAGDPWYILTSKLKIVKDVLRNLNNSVGNLHSKVEAARTSLFLTSKWPCLHCLINNILKKNHGCVTSCKPNLSWRSHL